MADYHKMKLRIALCVGLFLISHFANAESQRVVSIQKLGATVAISEVIKDGIPHLEVKLIKNNKMTAFWSHVGFVLDTDANDKWRVEESGGATYLMLSGYTGGAHCCWSLFVYELNNAKYLGEHLSSQGPYRFQKGNAECPTRVRWTPISTANGISPQYSAMDFQCFDKGKFTEDRTQSTQNIYREEIDAIMETINNEQHGCATPGDRWQLSTYLSKLPVDHVRQNQIEKLCELK